MSKRALQSVSVDALPKQCKVRASFPGYASGTHKPPSEMVPQVCFTYPHGSAQPRLTTLSRLPAHVSLESAALLEPLSVAIHATRRAAVEQGDTAIVFGAGTVGLLTAAMAKMSGATTVVIVDVDPGRIDYALANGFAHKGFVVPSQRTVAEAATLFHAAKELATDVMQVASLDDDEFEGADVTFDCTGKEICMQAGLFVSTSSTMHQPVAYTRQGNKTWRKAHHGRDGHSCANPPNVCIPSEGGRYHRHLPIREHLCNRNQDHLLWGASESGQHDHSPLQRSGRGEGGLRARRKDQRQEWKSRVEGTRRSVV